MYMESNLFLWGAREKRTYPKASLGHGEAVRQARKSGVLMQIDRRTTGGPEYKERSRLSWDRDGQEKLELDCGLRVGYSSSRNLNRV
jgi:hypothetical protein